MESQICKLTFGYVKSVFSDDSSDSKFAAPFILGGAHYRAGHWAEAKTKLTEMLAQNRRSSSIPIAWLFLAMVEKKLGNDGLATEAFETAEKKYAEVAASRKNGEPIIVVDFHYPLLKEEYKALRTQSERSTEHLQS